MSQAVFTIAQDELDLLPLWVAHYRAYAPNSELYVLDHDSVGDAAYYLEQIKQDGVHVVPVHHAESFDYDWLARAVEDFMRFLLRSYATVCFSEVDELLLPLPSAHSTLDGFNTAHSDEVVRAQGYCVVHDRAKEPDVDWSRPVLLQRQHWYPSSRYSKICVARTPVFYSAGFHSAYNVPSSLPVSSSLLCVHLHQADYKTTLRRHQRNAGRSWSGKFRISPQGVHQRLDNPADLERYLLCNLDKPTEFAQLVEIPQAIKDAYKVCLA